MSEGVLEKPMVGPKGGELNREDYHPDWRREEFHGSTTELHRFERDDSATIGRKNEQPWHRMAAYMLLAGRTNSEIALAANVCYAAVSQLRSQKWFQQLLATLSNEEGGEVLGVIKSESLASVETIVKIRDDEMIKAQTRLSAAVTLLEHAEGKPVQKTIHARSHDSNLSPQEEYTQLQNELAALRNKEI